MFTHVQFIDVPCPGVYVCSCVLQALTKLGALNVPEWYDAGKVAQDNSFAPFSKSLLCAAD